MDDNSKTTTALVIIGIITFIIAVIVITVLIRKVNTVKKQEVEITEDIIYFDIYPRSNYVYNQADYIIKKQGYIVQEGVIKQGIIERINNLQNQTNYTVSLNNSDFYYTESICNPVKKICTIDFEKIAEVQVFLLSIKKDTYMLVLHIDNGVIQDPMICLGENSEYLIKPKLSSEKHNDFLEINTPNKHKLYHDKCYYLASNEDIRQKKISEIMQKFEGDIRKYNKKHRTKLTNFENITFTDQEYLSFPRDSMEEGYYYFFINFETKDDKTILDNDKINFLLLDSANNAIKKNLYIS